MRIDPGFVGEDLQRLDVWSHHEAEPVRIGALSYQTGNAQSVFEWADGFTTDLSPFGLPIAQRTWSSSTAQNIPTIFEKLPGLLNDSLPDGWGKYLMDKHLARVGVVPRQITPALRLACMGDRAWGSLSFKPAMDESEHSQDIDMKALAIELNSAIKGHVDEVSSQMIAAGSSGAGARPKVMLDLLEANPTQARASVGIPDAGYGSWLIKFAANEEHPDAPIMEQVYMELARAMGIETMESRVMTIAERRAFATRRFDRKVDRKVFAHSVSGLLQVSHQDCLIDYKNLAEITERLGIGAEGMLEGFRRAAFNAAMSVRDDHAKNFAFLFDEGRWKLSPAYDLTYMEGPGGYHSTAFAGSSVKDPERATLVATAKVYGLEKVEANRIIDAAQDQRTRFLQLSLERGADEEYAASINKRLEHIARGFSRGR